MIYVVFIRKFDDTNTWNLPVVQGEAFVGFISKSTILNQYRALLKGYSTYVDAVCFIGINKRISSHLNSLLSNDSIAKEEIYDLSDQLMMCQH
jgi:hypothetical protein